MSDNKRKLKGKSRRGRPPKHGGYSLIARDELLKQHPQLRRYLEECRNGLVKDVAGTEEGLSEQQRIMIDRIISRLSICRLIEVYIEKYGAFRRDKLKRDKILELEPALGLNYLAFSNSIDRALISLGLEKKQVEPELSLAEVIREIEEKREAEKAKTQAQGKASEEAEKSNPGANSEEVSGKAGQGEEER